jgi:hypothetical protein
MRIAWLRGRTSLLDTVKAIEHHLQIIKSPRVNPWTHSATRYNIYFIATCLIAMPSFLEINFRKLRRIVLLCFPKNLRTSSQCRLKGWARRARAQGPDKIGAPQSRDKKEHK